MADRHSPSQLAFEAIVREAVTSILRPAGFHKTSKTFHWRLGGCVQVVNAQISQCSTWDKKRFYMNVGLAFEALCHLTARPILERHKEYECDDRGTHDRLERLVGGADASWLVKSGHGSEPTKQLAGAIRRLAAELDVIDGPATYRSHRWFDRFRPKPENAQVMYVLGENVGAREEVDRLVELYADRRNANRPEWWIERLGLVGLSTTPP